MATFVSNAVQRKTALARRASCEIRRFPVARYRPTTDTTMPRTHTGAQIKKFANVTATASTMTAPTSTGDAYHFDAAAGRHSCTTASFYPVGRSESPVLREPP